MNVYKNSLLMISVLFCITILGVLLSWNQIFGQAFTPDNETLYRVIKGFVSVVLLMTFGHILAAVTVGRKQKQTVENNTKE